MDTNPPDVDSEWHKFFEETKHPAWFAQIFKQPSGLSPEAENTSNLTNPDYYRLLKQGKKAEWVKVYIDGSYGFVVDGQPVYPDYNDNVHRQEVDPVPGVPIRIGLDFGLTPAAAFSQMLPDGRWLVFDEMVSKNLSFDQFSDDLLDHCQRSFRGGATFLYDGDPAGAQRAQTDKRTCFEIGASKGMNIEPSEQDPLLRMESVRRPLRTFIGGEPTFILHPRCKKIRKGMLGGYHLRRIQVAGAQRFAQRPDKGELSHVMNALEYTAAQLFAPMLTRNPQDIDNDGPQIGYEAVDSTRSEVTGY